VAPASVTSTQSIELIALDSVPSASTADRREQDSSRFATVEGRTTGWVRADSVTQQGSRGGDRGIRWAAPGVRVYRESPENQSHQEQQIARGTRPYILWAEALRSWPHTANSDNTADMKFSHSIQFNAVPDWSAYYIAYDNLKKLYVTPVLARG
jgi:phosphate transporter